MALRLWFPARSAYGWRVREGRQLERAICRGGGEGFAVSQCPRLSRSYGVFREDVAVDPVARGVTELNRVQLAATTKKENAVVPLCVNAFVAC